MPLLEKLNAFVNSPAGEKYLTYLYGDSASKISQQKTRYAGELAKFAGVFPNRKAAEVFTAPGRTEVGGNHTDHNGGRVLAAAVNLDNLAVAAKNSEGVIRVHSEGYPTIEIGIDHLTPVESEKFTSAALLRGVCARLKELGYATGSFDSTVAGDVPKGSGLSSSAAFEVLLVTILNHLYNDGKIGGVLAAQIGQYAENHFFGKPCGLMDQTTSAVGGFVTIDFQDFKNPKVRKVDFDFASSGHSVVIVDTGGHHADLNDEYAAVAGEMKEIARSCGGQVLREFSPAEVLKNLQELRKRCGDRAIQRALHFFADDHRVTEEVSALEMSDFPAFLRLVNESGRSSWMLLQNCYTHKDLKEQGVALSLAVTARFLDGRGACRVHGGGFAGTIQAFVPNEMLDGYILQMESFLGPGSCYPLKIRPVGAERMKV